MIHIHRLLTALVLVIVGAGPALAKSPTDGAHPQKPTGVVGQAGCVKSGCHIDIKDYAKLHGPVAVNACDACHVLSDPEAHAFVLARQGAEMCTYCHEHDIDGLPVVHEPVAKGECLGCHDPHGGQVVATLRENSIPELCGRCHEDVTRGMTFLHNPVQVGACTSCHPPHASRLPKLLDVSGTDLCLYCHADVEHELAWSSVAHKAMEEGCEACHGVHGSTEPMSLLATTTDLCLKCHEGVKSALASADHMHSPVTTGRACVTCHAPHGATVAKLMADLPARLCMECHDEDVKTPDGRTVAAVAEVVDPTTVKHGPIKDGQCAGCHNAHGGERGFLLAMELSDERHQSFAPERFELCFTCHDLKLAANASADGATGFRDGNWNLHYVHVAADERGRNCLLCHDTHAAPAEKIVRKDVTYGQWTMPIGFAKSETGGTCQPGCHVPFTYDRERPAIASTRPSVERLQQIARAERTGLMEMQLIAETSAGEHVRVPHEHWPTVIVSVRPGAQSMRDLVRAMRDVLEDESAQIVLLAAGDGCAGEAQSVLAREKVDWPILSDPDGAIAEQLDIRAWPSAVVVGPDGTEVARTTGAATSLAVRVRPYVGSTTASESAPVDPSIVRSSAITDGSDHRTRRRLRIAEHLLDKGRAAEAEHVLVDALRDDPESPPLRLALVRSHIALDRGRAALALLDQLPQTPGSEQAVIVLRAEAMISLEQWGPAESLLTLTVERDPDFTDAHYLLGQIYEQAGDWERAARSYRAARVR